MNERTNVPNVPNTRPDIRVFVQGKHDGLMMREAKAEAKLRLHKDPVVAAEVLDLPRLYLDVVSSCCGVLVLRDKAADPRIVREVFEVVRVLDPRARPVVFVHCVPSDASIVLNDVQQLLEDLRFSHGFWYPVA